MASTRKIKKICGFAGLARARSPPGMSGRANEGVRSRAWRTVDRPMRKPAIVPGVGAAALQHVKKAPSTLLAPGDAMRTLLGAALIAIAVAAAPAAGAQTPPRPADKAADVTDLVQLRADIQRDKRAFIASKMSLSDAEARKFWPIYDSYQRALDVVDRRRSRAIIDVVGHDRPLTDAYAKQLASDLIAADDNEIRARKTLQNRLMRALPPRKAVRYLQLESKIRAVEAYDVAQSLPLVR
jgi:Spy/CpxP family protein refolding chaperone